MKPGQRVAGTGHADDLFGRDVRRDRRCADRPPRQRLAGEEVSRFASLPPPLPKQTPDREDEDAGEVGQHDCDIQCPQTHGATPAVGPVSANPSRRRFGESHVAITVR